MTPPYSTPPNSTPPRNPTPLRTFYSPPSPVAPLSSEERLHALEQMLRIRQFEQRAEAAYQQGKIGGFFHSYMGQEAIQIAAVAAFGLDNWYTTTYRCHALALLLGESPVSLMAELFGRAEGNAKGRGGSMHFFSKRLLGGFGIVGGHVPIAIGAGFSLRYQEIKNSLSICFLGDGAVAQGSVHESLNLASLWNLPCIFVIENNQWGMGTAVENAVSIKRLAEDWAPAYQMQGYTVDGMDFFACYDAFKTLYKQVCETSRPILIEAVTERFRGHSISDPGLYRSKDAVKSITERDPLLLLRDRLIAEKVLDMSTYENMEAKIRKEVIAALEEAEKLPWPDPVTLEEDVFAK